MKTYALLLTLSFLTLACGPQAAAQSVPLVTATRDDVTLELHTDGPLRVGQNLVRYRVLHDGTPAPHATLLQRPVMEMMAMGMTHSCPVQKPDHEPDADGFFPGLIIFNMPSGEDARWTLSVEVELHHDGPTTTVELGELAVEDSPLRQFVTRDGKKVLLTAGLVGPAKLGANTLLVTAHSADAMLLEWTPVTDLAFTVIPEMPSMGHGSANNQAPQLGEDGLYRGTVNFSMAGEWVVHLGMTSGDATFGTFDFPFSF
ncbi:MAG: FixH family protein [Archangium sp.]|nr:FixH family protein [Archangium sp.]